MTALNRIIHVDSYNHTVTTQAGVLVGDLVRELAEYGLELPGSYDLAGVPVEVNDGVVRNSAGVLAGSALTLADAVRNASELGIEPAAALTAVTATPAALHRRPDLGVLHPGSRADLVIFDQHLQLERTLIGGVACEGIGA